jgi:hypothetical protein
MLIFLNLLLLLFVEFASKGLPTKSTPTFFTPLANGRGASYQYLLVDEILNSLA